MFGQRDRVPRRRRTVGGMSEHLIECAFTRFPRCEPGVPEKLFDHPGLPVPGKGNHSVSRDVLNGATGQLAETADRRPGTPTPYALRSTDRRPPVPAMTVRTVANAFLRLAFAA